MCANQTSDSGLSFAAREALGAQSAQLKAEHHSTEAVEALRKAHHHLRKIPVIYYRGSETFLSTRIENLLREAQTVQARAKGGDF